MADVRNWAVKLGSTKLLRWETLELRRAIDQLAHSFTLGLYDAWPGEDLPFGESDAIEIEWHGDRALTGYIDRLSATYDGLQLSGRSKTADLIDCSATNSPGEWKKADLLKIAVALTGDFDIGAGSDTDLGTPLRSFTIQEGEAVAEAIERLARLRGVLATCDAYGDVRFTRAGSRKASTRLEYGVNILPGATFEASSVERFSDYTVKSQVAGDDNFFGEPAAAAQGSAADSVVSRHRPLVVLSESQESGKELEKRAEWERTVRAGRARRVQYTVAGSEHLDGYLWDANMLVDVNDPRLRIKGELLITAATIRVSEQGTTTTLELASPKAFTVEPVPAPKPKGGLLSWL